MRRRYPAMLRDGEWAKVQAIFEPPVDARGGRPRVHGAREVLDAILYVMKEGGSWRALPRDFPPWKTVYAHRQLWTEDGTLERAMSALARARR